MSLTQVLLVCLFLILFYNCQLVEMAASEAQRAPTGPRQRYVDERGSALATEESQAALKQSRESKILQLYRASHYHQPYPHSYLDATNAIYPSTK